VSEGEESDSYSDQRYGDVSLQDIAELDVVGAIKPRLHNLPSPPLTSTFVSDK
jgi:hypothetical protein